MWGGSEKSGGERGDTAGTQAGQLGQRLIRLNSIMQYNLKAN